MAFLQPENLASRSYVPDRLQVVARALRDLLPEDATVWLERTGDGDTAAAQHEFEGMSRIDTSDVESYLVLLDPQTEIAVLETPTKSRIRSVRRGTDPKAQISGGLLNRLGFRRSAGPKQTGGARSETGRERIQRITAERASQLHRGVGSVSISALPVGEA